MDNIKYEEIKFDNINNKEINNLLRKMLNKNDKERINSNEALKIIKNIKKNIKYSENEEKEYKIFMNNFRLKNHV